MTSASLNHDLAGTYDRLAANYDKLHRRWLRHAGGEAQAALEAIVRALVTTDTNLLDAGCGTGALARSLIAEGMSPARVTLLDPSKAMLERCIDTDAPQVNGRLEALPFESRAFDVVTCAWALETAQDQELALRELCRVVRRGGVLCLVFCAEKPTRDLAEWLSRLAVTLRGTGQFLSCELVIDILRRSGEFDLRTVPTNGPAATLLARRLF
jgi:ubiquinone/menaquinone biosynthesis C-methylase UbiE